MTPSEPIPFVKVTACGNDFLIVEGIDPDAGLSSLSQRMCDRRTGIGADGVEWLFPDSDADVRAHLFNADGSEAEISGNGTRGVAAYMCSKAYREKIVVRTGAGPRTCMLTSHNRQEYEFEIAMGEPQVGEELLIPVGPTQVKGVQISMGNPHFVSLVKEFPSNWSVEACKIGGSARFNHGINVEYVIVRDKSNIDARFFERGVGETLSSGTGSCAAAVAAITAEKAASPLRVHAAGGTQTVRWEREVFLSGAASLLFQGEFFV